MFSAARKLHFFYNNTMQQACALSSLVIQLPANLRGNIFWRRLPSSPLEPNTFASYICTETKSQYTLEFTKHERIKVNRLDPSTHYFNEIFSFGINQVPAGWKIPGINYGIKDLRNIPNGC